MQQALKLSDAGLQRSGRELSIHSEDSEILREPLQAAHRQTSLVSDRHDPSSPSSYQSSIHSPGQTVDEGGHGGVQTTPLFEKQMVKVDWVG